MKTLSLMLALMIANTTFATTWDITEWTNHTVCEQGQVQLQVRWSDEDNQSVDWRLVIEETGIVRHLVSRQAVPAAVSEQSALILDFSADDADFKHNLEGRELMGENLYYSLDFASENAELELNAFQSVQLENGDVIEESKKLADYFFEDCLQLIY